MDTNSTFTLRSIVKVDLQAEVKIVQNKKVNGAGSQCHVTVYLLTVYLLYSAVTK